MLAMLIAHPYGNLKTKDKIVCNLSIEVIAQEFESVINPKTTRELGCACRQRRWHSPTRRPNGSAIFLLRCMSLLLAQMRSADRVRKCLLFGVDRTYRGHHETDAVDPKPTSAQVDKGPSTNLCLKSQRLAVTSVDQASRS